MCITKKFVSEPGERNINFFDAFLWCWRHFYVLVFNYFRWILCCTLPLYVNVIQMTIPSEVAGQPQSAQIGRQTLGDGWEYNVMIFVALQSHSWLAQATAKALVLNRKSRWSMIKCNAEAFIASRILEYIQFISGNTNYIQINYN